MDRRAFILGSVGLAAVARPSQAAELLFWDTFDRPDTRAGDLGVPTPIGGERYDLRGPYSGRFPLPPSRAGQVKEGAFVSDPGTVVYAARRLLAVPMTMRAKASWVANPARDTTRDPTGSATAALLVAGDDRLIADMGVHVVVNRSVARFEKRIGGGEFHRLGEIKFDPTLPKDGAPTSIEVTIAPDGWWRLQVDYLSAEGRDAEIVRHMSEICAWEIYQPGSNDVDQVRFHEVSAWSN